MNSYLSTVNQLVDQFTENPRWVTINRDVINSTLPKIEIPKNIPVSLGFDSIRRFIEFEIIANAVNYCYWYGAHDIRPSDCGASKMYKLLAESYAKWSKATDSIDDFLLSMASNRFPLMNQRYLHLNEIRDTVNNLASEILTHVEDVESALFMLCSAYTTYSQDMFLKRASLFFMQVYRRTGLFKDQINLLPIPADYQVPKMLRHLGILDYNQELRDIIWRGDLIPAGSRMEIEIRASAIKACRIIADLANLNSSQVDDWLWLNRKSCSDPFHLTITTDY